MPAARFDDRFPQPSGAAANFAILPVDRLAVNNHGEIADERRRLCNNTVHMVILRSLRQHADAA